MTVIVAAIVGFLAGRMMWLAIRKSWSRQALMRQNYQGVSLPTAAGITLGLTLVLVEAVRAIVGAIGIGDDLGLTPVRAAALVVVLGFTILGLVDDLVGSGPVRGLNGHLRALGKGELTSGAVKMFGGVATALVAAAFLAHGGLGNLIVDAAVIALAANMANLLDLRPGRTTKVGIFVFVLMALLSKFDAALVPVAIVVGAAAAIILDDLHERIMLGDTGANALGAAIGLGIVVSANSTGRVIAAVILLGLTVVSEFLSFSKLIDGIAPLRALDNFGRKRTSTIDLRNDGYRPEARPEPATRRGASESPFGSASAMPEDFPPRHETSAPSRGSVDAAHGGFPASSPTQGEQSPFTASSQRSGQATPSTPSFDEPAPPPFTIGEPRSSSYPSDAPQDSASERADHERRPSNLFGDEDEDGGEEPTRRY